MVILNWILVDYNLKQLKNKIKNLKLDIWIYGYIQAEACILMNYFLFPIINTITKLGFIIFIQFTSEFQKHFFQHLGSAEGKSHLMHSGCQTLRKNEAGPKRITAPLQIFCLIMFYSGLLY